MEQSEVYELRRIATCDPDYEIAKEALRKLREINPTYHWCQEWDYLVICDKDREYESCSCIKD